jgi:hypothetical protein
LPCAEENQKAVEKKTTFSTFLHYFELTYVGVRAFKSSASAIPPLAGSTTLTEKKLKCQRKVGLGAGQKYP